MKHKFLLILALFLLIPTNVHAATVKYEYQSTRVKASPTLEAKTIGIINRGSNIDIIKEFNNGWTKINYNGTMAYVLTSTIENEKTEIKINSTDFCENDGTTTEWVEKARERLESDNPSLEKVKNHFMNNGWHFYVTGKNIAKDIYHGEYKSVQGCILSSEKSIYIESRDIAIENATLHELGHYVDHMTNLTSLSDEFITIYKEELDTFKNQITDSQAINSPEEFFAEIFSYIYKDNTKCTPKALEFVENKIDEL